MNKTLACIAVIGLGNIAIRHRRNLKHLFPDARVLAVSSSGRVPDELPENADEVLPSIANLPIEKVDFAIVASPAPFHWEHSKALMAANIPLLVEKPLSAETEDALQFLELAKAYSSPLGVGYCLRYLPSAQKVKEIVDSGILGPIVTVNAEVGQYLPNWRQSKSYLDSVSASKKLGGGALLELSHELDYLLWLFGDLTFEYGRLSSSKRLSLEVEEVADVWLSSAIAPTIILHQDFLQQQGKRTCTIIAEDGRLEWDLMQNSVSWYVEEQELNQVRFDGWDYNNMYLDMITKLLDDSSPGPACASISEGLATVRLINDIKQHSKQ